MTLAQPLRACPEGQIGRLGLICATRAQGTNAILEYSKLLDGALRKLGVESAVEEVRGRLPAVGRYDTVVLEYNPFLYGRWGFAPRLVTWLLRARARYPRLRVAVMVHEPFVPISDVKSLVLGSAQRLQLRALHSLSSVLFTSISRWATSIGQWRPSRNVIHLPVGSNLPYRADARGRTRSELSAERTFIVVSFGTGHPARLVDRTAAAVNAIASQRDDVLVLNLGADARALDGLGPRVRVLRPGMLPADEIAALMSAGDLFLAPLVDGMSSRRTSVIAAMQHGLPILTTDGPLTDRALRDSGALEMVPVDSRDAFADAAARLARDHDRRANLGERARDLFRREFAWPAIARRMVLGLQSAVVGEPR